MKPGKFDFKKDIAKHVLALLPYDRANRELVADIEALSYDRLLVAFLSWRDRLVFACPRLVWRSKEIAKNPLYLAHKTEVDHLFGKIRTGQDLTPHLSKEIENGYLPRNAKKPLSRNRSLDGLLNDWGMHHLHISKEMDPRRPGYVVRSEELLVLIFRRDVAFAIDVTTHSGFADAALVEIAHRTWPERQFFVKLNGILGSTEILSSNDRNLLRKAGYSTMIKVDGDCMVPIGGGVSAAGTSSWVSIYALRVLRTLALYSEEPTKLVEAFINHPDFASTKWPRAAQFEFLPVVFPSGFSLAIREKETGHAIEVS